MDRSYRTMFTADSSPLDGIVKVVSVRSKENFYVDWWLMNHCSWDCSYCHEIIKSGNIDLPKYLDCVEFVDQLIDHCAKIHKSCVINFTGGEVTEWSEFDDLVSYAHDKGAMIMFRTNANLTVERWNSLLEKSHKINVEVHPEFTSISHFLIMLDRAVKSSVHLDVNVNMTKEHWEAMEELCNKIKERHPHIYVRKKMLFQDPVFNTKPLDYKPEQIVKIKKQLGDLVMIDDQGKEYITHYHKALLENKNVFKKWKCWAGVEQIIVDAYGKIFKGHCRIDGYLGKLGDEEVYWMDEPKDCTTDICKNAFYILSTKKRII